MGPWEHRAVGSTLTYLRLLQTGVAVMTKLKICHATSFSTLTVTDLVFSETSTAGRCLESHRTDGQRDEDGKLKNKKNPKTGVKKDDDESHFPFCFL